MIRSTDLQLKSIGRPIYRFDYDFASDSKFQSGAFHELECEHIVPEVSNNSLTSLLSALEVDFSKLTDFTEPVVEDYSLICPL